MELKEFVTKVLKDLVDAVEEARASASRDMHLNATSEQRTVEFDIAVTVQDTVAGKGKAGIKVLQFVEAGGDLSKEKLNSTVSRIRFGVHIDFMTKDELARAHAMNNTSSDRELLNGY